MDDSPARVSLKRAMGFGDVVLFFVVAVVGLRWLATAAAAGPSGLVVWIIGCVGLFVPLAFAVVELSSRHPEEGGIYVWTRHAFGGFAGFMAAWMYWVSNLVYAPGLLYFMAGNALFVGGASWQGLAADPTYYIAVSLAGIALGIGLNVVGLDVGKQLHNFGAWSTWVPVLVLVGMGVVAWLRFGAATDFSPQAMIPSTRLDDIYFWSTIAFAFGGFEAASIMGGEIRDPRRNVPRAVVVSGIVIALVYVLGTAAILVALPGREVSGLQGIMQAIQRIADRIGWPAVTPVAAILISVGALGGAAAWLAATSRLLFVAGVDRYLPAPLARIHPRWGTPATALVAQGIGAAAFVVMGQAGATVRGAYDFLVSMGVITYFVPFLLMFAAWMKVQREPAPAEALRTPGGRPAALALASLGFTTTAISIALAVFPPGDSAGDRAAAALKVMAASAIVIGLGVLLFFKAARTR